MTAFGAVAGMVALQAVIDGRYRDALLWLLAAQILDGLDGPIARKIDVEFYADRIDGRILDLVVDYITCVLVPLALLVRLELLPTHFETLVVGAVFLFSALWFARTDLETEDHWFNGFPAAWNLVVPTFLIMGSTRTEVLIVTIALCISQLTNLKFPHKVEPMRWVTLPFAVLYLGNLAWLSWDYSPTAQSHANLFQAIVLIGFPLYIMLISVWRTWFAHTHIPLLGWIQYD
jgi:phosphatidylcholine synthase